MATAKVFMSGNSQAVRLPKAFQFTSSEVEIFRRNDEIVLKPKPQNAEVIFDIFTAFSDDFFEDGRQDEPPQERENL